MFWLRRKLESYLPFSGKGSYINVDALLLLYSPDHIVVLLQVVVSVAIINQIYTRDTGMVIV